MIAGMTRGMAAATIRQLGLVAALAAGACAGTPATLSPPATATGPFTASPVATSAPAADDWWRLYDDPALDRLVLASLAANADLRAAYARLDGARAATAQARAARLPQPRIESSLDIDNPAKQPSAAGVPASDYDIAATISWDIDLFGRLRAAATAARADAAATAAALDGLRVAVAADTVAAYVDLCAARQGADLVATLVAVQSRSAELLRRQQAVGEVSGLEVAQAETLASSSRAALPSFEAARNLARYRLAELQGLAPTAWQDAGLDCQRLPRPLQPIPIGDGQALLLRRPDLREAEQRLAAATARIGVATADLYPSVNLGGALGLLAGGFVATASPLVTWTFPNTSLARARIAQASAAEQAAVASWDATVLRALREVESALESLRREAQRQALLGEALGSAERAAHLAQTRVRIGDVAPLIALDAERSRAELARQKLDSEISLARLTVTLFRALGGGWQATAEPAPVAASGPGR